MVDTYMTSCDKDPAVSNDASTSKADATAATSPGAPLTSPAPNQDARQRLAIRQSLRQLRKNLPAARVAEHSRLIARQLSPLLADAQHIAGYLAFGNEVNVDDLLATCRAQHSQTYVPLIQADHTLLFSRLDENTRIVQNRYGIREPVQDSRDCLTATQLDAVLVPLLGFDPQCNRMGMGGGFYDRSFAHRRQSNGAATCSTGPLLIGVAHQLQCVDSLTSQWWDVPLDLVVTEQRVYRRNSE